MVLRPRPIPKLPHHTLSRLLRIILARLLQPVLPHHNLHLLLDFTPLLHLHKRSMRLLCIPYALCLAIALHLATVPRDRAERLIYPTYGIHLRSFYPSPLQLLILDMGEPRLMDSRQSMRSQGSWTGALISRSSSQTRLAAEDLSSDTNRMDTVYCACADLQSM
jgi:hypothetical protein